MQFMKLFVALFVTPHLFFFFFSLSSWAEKKTCFATLKSLHSKTLQYYSFTKGPACKVAIWSSIWLRYIASLYIHLNFKTM